MSGKKKQAQRTKGNAKPSSSCRAAELLAASGGTTSGFVGFGSFSGDLGYVPATTAGNDDVDSAIDADFRLVLRKLSKKDSTTKLKALQEFAALCKDKETDEVKLVLPYWPRVYSRVAIDNDRRVREAAQQAFEQLVLRVRRNLAPHLKSIMGSWLVSQCDGHAPAASAAKAAFQCAFPPTKQTEALVFCKNEILAHIQDNLFIQTAQSLSDPKTTSPEEMEAKHQRLVASTLMALRLFIDTAPTSQHESLLSQYRGILGNAKLWKMAKHSSELIQGAFYSLLAAVCHHLPELANEFSDKICPIVLHNLDKTDPIVCPALWEAALNVVTNIQDCWEKVNARKGVLPKLWGLLRQGAGGSASAVFPNLLPFLSRIPAEIIGPGTAFYQEFFSNMKEGLATDRVQLSPSECAAVIQAFIECLRYTVSQHLNDLDTSRDITSYLLLDQLLPLVEASLVDKSPALAASPLFPLAVELITYLHKTATASDESTTTSAAKKAFNAFWDSFASMCVNVVASEVPEHTLQRLATLVKSFRNPTQCVNKKKFGKVRFADDDVKSSPMSVAEKAAVAGILPPSYDDIFEPTPEIARDGGEAFTLVCRLCQCSCVNTCKKHVSVPHIQFLASLARSYMSESLMHALLAQLGIADVQRTASQSEIVLAFVQRLLLPWLCSCDDIADVTSRRGVVDSLVDITVSVLGVCSLVGDRVKLLTVLLEQIQSAVVLSTLVQRVQNISHDAAVHQWFHGDTFGERMVAMTTRLCESSLRSAEWSGGEVEVSEEMDACWTLLCFALSATPTNEPQISTGHIDRILVEIRTALPTPDHLTQSTPNDIHRCVSFVCDITHTFFVNIQGCVVMRSAEELLLSLFRLSCQHCILPENLVQRVSTTWQQGVQALIRQNGGYLGNDSFLVQAVSLVKSLLHQDVDTVDKLMGLYDDTLTLAHCVTMSLATDTDTTPDLTNPLVRELLHPLCAPLTHHGTPHVTPQCLCAPLLTGQLTFASCGKTDNISPSRLPKHLTAAAFSSLLLVAMQPVAMDTVSVATSDGDEEGVSEEAGSEGEGVDESALMDLAYSVAFCRAHLGLHRQALEASDMGKLLRLLEGNFSRLFEPMSPEGKKMLVQHAISRSLDSGHLWSLALQVMLESLRGSNICADLLAMKGSMDRFVELTECSLHTLQALLPYLPQEDVIHVAEIRAAQLLTCPPEELLSLSGGLGFLSVYRVTVSLLHDMSSDDAASTDMLLSIETLLSLSSDASAIHSALCDTEWTVLSYNIELMRLMRVVVTRWPSSLSPKDWDVVLCRAVSMVQMCDDAVTRVSSDMAIATFITEACHLVTAVATCMQMVVPHHPDNFPPEILTEWTELFSASIYSVLLPMFDKLSGGQTFELSSTAQDIVMKAVSSAVALCPLPHLMKHQMAPLLLADEDTNLPDELQTLMNRLCPLLLSSTRAVQLAAYSALMSVMPSLPAFDEGKRKEDEKGEGSRSPPMALMNVLDTSSHAVELVLQECDIGETALVESFSEEHTYCMAYLLSWKLLLVFFKSASSELRSEFAQHLQQRGAVDRLLLDLFRLLPQNPETTPQTPQTPHRATERGIDSRNMFVDEPPLTIAGEWSVAELPHMACAVYFHVLEDLPAIMRQWWNRQDKRVASIVDRYTSRYVSPVLCAQEMRAVLDKDTVLTNMTVKVRPVTREVVALYVVEEITMELVVTLPVNHPLGPISVECGRRVGVANTQWRNWMLQMVTFLSHQNGSILDGLLLWKRSVDKRFEGVEDCMVCFSVIHGTNYQLPRLQCRTCKKKFHSACLYKWFSTSNKSTCPLCRNLF